jgi:hypothetical protein
MKKNMYYVIRHCNKEGFELGGGGEVWCEVGGNERGFVQYTGCILDNYVLNVPSLY